jgi:hypothetical protein
VASKESSRVEGQGELGLVRRAEPNDMPIEVVRRQRSPGSAFSLACQSSGLEDKEIYTELGIDAGYFSRIKKGEATLQADLHARFCEVVNNRIYAEWLAYQIGCTLVQIKSEAERLLEQERAKAAKLTEENRLMKQLLTGRIPEVA